MKKYFVLYYSRGPNWRGDENWDKQDLMAHGEYMSQLQKNGILILGGPFNDATGGLSVIKVDTKEEAEMIIEKDPAILNGVFSVNIHPWLIAFEAK